MGRRMGGLGRRMGGLGRRMGRHGRSWDAWAAWWRGRMGGGGVAAWAVMGRGVGAWAAWAHGGGHGAVVAVGGVDAPETQVTPHDKKISCLVTAQKKARPGLVSQTRLWGGGLR